MKKNHGGGGDNCSFHRWALINRSRSWRTWRCVDCQFEITAAVNRSREICWSIRRVQPTIQEFLNDGYDETELT